MQDQSRSRGMLRILTVSLAIVATLAVARADLWKNVSPVSWSIQDLSFADDRNGWAIGEPGILKTTDAGDTWSKISGPTGGMSIWFWDMHQGLISNQTEVLETSDGGDTWDVVSILPFYHNYSAQNRMHFVDQQNGWMAVDSLLHTTDGGHTWDVVSIGLPNYHKYSYTKWCCESVHLRDVFFANEHWGWVVGGYTGSIQHTYLDGFVFETKDGGQSWARWWEPWMRGYKDGVFGFPGGPAWAVGSSEIIYKRRAILPDDPLHDGSLRGNQEYWELQNARGPGSQYNSGFFPGSRYSEYNERLFVFADIWFSDPLTGWVVGDRILHTSDGGETWIEEYNVLGDQWLTSIGRAGNRLVVVGGNGEILIRSLSGETVARSSSWGQVKATVK